MKTKKNPSAMTMVMVCALLVPSLALARTVSGNYTLTSDEDWSGDGIVTLDSATIDLAGYTLKVVAINGIGSIVSTETPFNDLTTTDASKVVAEGDACLENYPASYAFNDSMTRTSMAYVPGGIKTHTAIGWDFGAETCVNCYRIYPGVNSNISVGWPKDWTFEGSDDCTSWTVLDTREGEAFNVSTWNTYQLESSALYRYYRVNFTAQQGSGRFNVDELEFGFVPVSRLQFDATTAADSDFTNITLGENVRFALDLFNASGQVVIPSTAGAQSVAFELVSGNISANVDLNGHTLIVNSLAGGGTITDSSADTLTDLTTTNGLSLANKFIWASTNGVEVALAGVNGNGVDGSKYPAERAFDDDLCTSQIVVDKSGGKGYSFAYYYVPSTWDWGGDTYELNYKFCEPTLVNRYRIYPFTPSNALTGTPKTWSFEGSDNGTAWIELDSRTEPALENKTWYDYDTSNIVAYSYYRLRIKDVRDRSKSRIDVGELEFCYRPDPGKLVVNVPTGKTVVNDSVALTGNLSLVKEGDGTLVASKSGQTYIGGTEVVAGTLKCGTTDDALFGQDGTEVYINNGGTFDINGQKGSIGKYVFTIDGGCLAQTATMSGDTTANYQSVLEMTLKGDGTFDAEKNMHFGTSTFGIDSLFDLGGNTFSGVIGNGQFLRFQSMTLKNGTFNVTGGGGYLLARGGVVATNVDFKLNCAVVVRGGDVFSVRDYEALGGTGSTSTQNGTMAVYGTFTPTSDSFYGCTLMDGSTLDLSTRSTTLNPYSDFTAGATTLKFEANATVNVVLGSRRTGNAPIMSWTAETKPENIDTVKFVRADADRRYSLIMKSDGLYASEGLIITIY